MSPTRVRPVETSHIAELIRIADETNLNPWTAASYLEELKNPGSLMFRIESDENTSIGFIVGRIVPAADNESASDAEIYNVGVDRPYQRQGFGQTLIDHFVARCVDNGVRSIWLEVRESNTTAMRVYERNGFEAVHTRKDFYVDPRENGILMRKILAS